MKITKEYLRTVIKEELERLDEAFYQGGGEAGEAAYDDLQASTGSQYGNAPKGDRSAAAAAAYKSNRSEERANALSDKEKQIINHYKDRMIYLAQEIQRDEQGNAVVRGSKKIANMLLSGQFGKETQQEANKFLSKGAGRYKSALDTKKYANRPGNLRSMVGKAPLPAKVAAMPREEE